MVDQGVGLGKPKKVLEDRKTGACGHCAAAVRETRFFGFRRKLSSIEWHSACLGSLWIAVGLNLIVRIRIQYTGFAEPE